MIADRYRLERKVGGGRVSAVWRVRDEISSRPCAIKLLHRSMHKHPEALTRFSLEDRLARELTGPHFPERVGSGVWDGMRYIAWRWHEGESLRALFERNPKQDAPTVHSIVQETCQALSLVHAAGYAHGDLKPENILFADRGDAERSTRQIKLLGFGVASRLSRPSAAGFGVSRRRPGEFVGTPLYSSPDLILGRVPNGGQADLWALAVIVYEALTGRPPFLGFDVGAVLQAILEKRAPRPSSVADNLPGSFDAWWAQALEQQFDTPSEFAGALARALAPALRTSHTQRSASLPDRSPSPLEALAPMAAAPPRGNASTTASGIGPMDVGIARMIAAAKSGKPASAAAPSIAPAAAAASSPAPASPLAASSAAVSAPLAAWAGSPAPGAAGAAVASVKAGAAGPAPAGTVSTAASSATAAAVSPAAFSPAALSTAAVTAESLAPSASLAPGGAPAVALAPAAAPAGAPALSPPLTTGVPPLASDAARAEPPANDTFAPFPSPLRDLGADGARKTLVGITPPSLLQSIASAVASRPATALSSAPAATRSVPPAASPLGASPPGISPPGAALPGMPAPAIANERTIEGAPCKPIETSEGHAAFDFAAFDASRRPANPTVPFPRPRPVPRTATLPNPSDETPDIGRASWHGTTTRTLRFVLTSPDHKPQRVAALLVCAAAALVIFAVGRSPIAGTAGIGQATGALSAGPNEKPAPPVLPPPSEGKSELRKASGRDPGAGPDAPDEVDGLDVEGESASASEPSSSAGDELAPGLVLPAPERAGSGGSPLAHPASEGAAKPRPAPAPAPPSAKAPIKKVSPPPPSPSLPPTPARQNSTELDFGI